MNQHKSEFYFLSIFLLGISILLFFIFKPFLFALILAVVFATVFDPLHKKILKMTKESKGLTAFLTTGAVLIIIVVPLTFLGIQIFQEATGLYSSLASNGNTINLTNNISTYLQNLTGFSPVPIDTSFDFNQYLKQGLSWLIQHIGPVFANVIQVILGIFIFLIALYYLFKDGHKLKSTLITVSPLRDVHDEIIFNKLALSVNSVIKGSLVVALIQGTLTAIGFTIFGVPNTVLWGSAAAIAALIPGFGTMLVIFPAILYLYFSGAMLPAFGLLIWGAIAVGLIDNLLGPKLVERGIKIHPFLILLSILGGIGFFGPLGFLLGPLILSLFFTLIEIYFLIRKEYGTQ
jgi:predicted PurR-regulated permease PerM